jgi:hypothetical protein
MVVAQMGIVAVNVEGQAIHSTFNFNLNGKPCTSHPIVADIQAFVGLRLLIIEEASTCVRALLGSIDARLR